MKRLLPFLLFLLPAVASAQSGVILFDRAVRFDFELPEQLGGVRDQLPTSDFSYMILLFNESESLMTPAPTENEDENEVINLRGRNITVSELTQRLKMGSTSRSDHEVLLKVYVNSVDRTVAEAREFMGRTFLISGTQPSYAWKLTGEQSEFLGYTVHKATTVQDSSVIEAWFTPEIPVSAGPGLFGGLPGMVLSVSVNDGHTVYSATEVKLTSVEDGAIRAPKDGQEVSRDQYEGIVAEKLEEVKLRRSGRRRRP